jgi:hypothetical protein
LLILNTEAYVREQYLDNLSTIFIQKRKEGDKTRYLLGYRHASPPYAYGSIPITQELFTALEKQTFAKKSDQLRKKLSAWTKCAKTNRMVTAPVKKTRALKKITGKPHYQTTRYCIEFNMDVENPDEHQWNLHVGGIQDPRWLMHRDECLGKIKILRKEQPDLLWRMIRQFESKTVVKS